MTPEQKKNISDSLGRMALLVKMLKLESAVAKSLADIPNVNNCYAEIFRVMNNTNKKLNKYAVKGDKLNQYTDDERVLTMYSILQFIGNLSQEHLTLIETQFEEALKQQ